jgi:hypothetical protein
MTLLGGMTDILTFLMTRFPDGTFLNIFYKKNVNMEELWDPDIFYDILDMPQAHPSPLSDLIYWPLTHKTHEVERLQQRNTFL